MKGAIATRRKIFYTYRMESFPPLSAANEEGLLAIGGDLCPQRLVLAYRNGIFPWYNEGSPILWWSPDPRCVFFPSLFRPHRSLRKTLKKGEFTTTFDHAFSQVIRACADQRRRQAGTWITPDMETAYNQLHRLGVAHSVETWFGHQLVGGLYGLAIGQVFFGESMFSTRTDASKVALARLMEHLTKWAFRLVDCQVTSPHLLHLGAQTIPRTEFIQRLQSSLSPMGYDSHWPCEPVDCTPRPSLDTP